VLRFHVGKTIIPVDVRRHGKKLAIRPARQAPELDGEFGSWVGGEFDRGLGCWLVTDCERNRLQIQALQGNDPFRHLRGPTTPRETGRRPELREHQKRIVGFAYDKKTALIASEQGTGKTLALMELLELTGGRWWWIGPARVLEDTKLQFQRWGAQVWPEEWLSWHGLPHFLKKYSGPAPHGIVGDECTILKGCGPIWKATMHLSKAMTEEHGPEARKVLLSGKPAPNEPSDWWAPVEVLAPGLLRESTSADLRARVGIFTHDEGFPKLKSWITSEVEKLGRRVAPVTLVIRAKDCLDLPPCEVEVVDLPVSEETKQAAKLVASTAAGGADALQKLRQLSDGFQYQEDHSVVRCPSPKEDFLRSKLVQCDEDGRIAVYAPYTASIDRVVEICREEGWTVLRCDGRGYDPGPELLREFDAATSSGEGKYAFVGHPRSGGFGLNLTAPRVQVLYSLDFDWGAFDQTIKRLHRLGQTRGVRIYVPSHLKTDRYVYSKLEAKEDLQNVTLDEIRRVLG
jgi:hypothetical protein